MIKWNTNRLAILIINGMVLRLASSKGEAPTTPAMATIIPAMGDAARPMLEANCIGRTNDMAGIPNRWAISGSSGGDRTPK